MELERLSPVNNQLLSDYWEKNEELLSFYQYPYNDESFQKRAKYLKGQPLDRKQLCSIIRQFMEPFGISVESNKNLEKLENGALAIVGGQQAGLLTGPLYSVHKAISVILLAKEQSEKLGIDVVPIFWIAGEDHDLDEINHTYTVVNGQLRKKIYDGFSRKKTMASQTNFDHDQMKEYIHEIFKDYGETAYTSKLYQSVLKQMDESETFTDFFAHLMNDLLKDAGLLFIDSAFPLFRQYQSTFFQQMIEKNEAIAACVVEKERLFEMKGYGQPIFATEENANLFYVREGERFLLERKNNQFVNASANVKFTKEELLQIALHHPEQLSNNVVTRPLMQEMSLPVLAFVAGPGELAYWATLKDAFDLLHLQMPILAPRLNITILTRQVEQYLLNYQLSVEQVFTGEVEKLKQQFIKSIQDKEVKDRISNIKEMLNEQYEQILNYLNSQNLHLERVVEKNKQFHQLQLDYLSNKIDQEILLQHDNTIRRFNTLVNELYPNGHYQERVYNPYQYLNIYGPSFISELLTLPMRIGNVHYLVKI